LIQTQVDGSVGRRTHALAAEQAQLSARAGALQAYLAAHIEYPVPWDARPAGQGVQGIAHQPRVVPKPGQAGDLTIGGNPTGRDPAHGGENARVKW